MTLRCVCALARAALFLKKKRAEECSSSARLRACDGELRGGWREGGREVGVLLSPKSVTHRIGMASLPKKPASLLSPLLSFCSVHKLTLYFFPFFFPLDYKSFSVWGDFSKITSRISCSSALSESTGRFSIRFISHANVHQCKTSPATSPSCCPVRGARLQHAQMHRLTDVKRDAWSPAGSGASQYTSSHTALKTAAPFFPLNLSRILDPPHPDVRFCSVKAASWE